MANMKEVTVECGSDLSDLVGRVRLACKRSDAGNVTAAQFLRLDASLYLVTGITATRGAVNGETLLTLTRLAGDGPPVALLSSRSPAPCAVARASDAEVIAAAATAATGAMPVHLNPPAPRPTRTAAATLRPVEFGAECAAPLTGKCGTRGQRFEPTEELETVSVLGATEGAPEWEAAVDATVTETPADPAPVTVTETPADPAPVTVTETPADPAPVTETEAPATEPAPKGKRSRKG